MRWIIALLLAFAIWTAFVLYVTWPLPDHFLVGGFLLAIGITNLVFWRTNGRKLFARTQAYPPFVARVWARGGEKGVQVLFLGVGVIFGFAGCIVMILGTSMT
jgi:hypothetical protein